MNKPSMKLVLFAAVQIFSLFCVASLLNPREAFSDEVRWVSESGGNWSDSTNWSSGRVPEVGDDVVIDSLKLADVVAIGQGSVQIQSLNLKNGTLLSVSGSSTQFSAVGSSDINNGRIRVADGASVRFPGVSSYSADFTSAPESTPIFLAEGANSVLDLSSITAMELGKNGSFHSIEAKAGAEIDFGGLVTVKSNITLGQGGTVKFKTETGGTVLLPSLDAFTSEAENRKSGTVGTAFTLEFENGSVSLPSLRSLHSVKITLDESVILSLPSLEEVDYSSISLSGNAALNAPNLTVLTYSNLFLSGPAQFNSGMLTNINYTAFHLANGAVFRNVSAEQYLITSRTDLSETMPAISVTGSSVLDLGSISLMSIGQNNRVFSILATDGGQVRFDRLTSITNAITYGQGGKVLFQTDSGGELYFPVLESIERNGHDGYSGTTGTALSFQFENGDIPIPNLRKLHSVTISLGDGESLSLPNLQSLDFSVLSLTGSAVLNAPNLSSLTFSKVFLSGPSQLNSGMLTNIDETTFQLDGGASFGQVAADSYKFYDHFDNSKTLPILSVSENSTLDLSSLTNMSLGKNSRTHVVEASSGGKIIFGGLTSIKNGVTAGGAGGVLLATSSGGELIFPSLESFRPLREDSNSGYIGTAFNLEFENGDIPIPNLRELHSVNIVLSDGESLSLPNLETLDYSVVSLSGNAVLHAPNLTNLTYSTVILSGPAQLNSGMLTNIDDTTFRLEGGASFDRIVADSYKVYDRFQNSNTVNVISVSEDSMLDLSSLSTMSLGRNRFTHTVQASSGGEVRFDGLTSISNGITYRESGTVIFHTDTSGKLYLSSLESLESDVGGRISGHIGTAFTFEFENGEFPIPNIRELHSVDISLNNGESLSLPNLESVDYSNISLLGNAAFNAPNLTSLSYSKLTLSGPAQLNSGMLSNIDHTSFHLSDGASFERVSAENYSLFPTFVITEGNPAISITNNSHLDLHTVSEITTGQNNYVYDFNITENSSLNLSGLTSLTTRQTNSGRTKLHANSGSTILLNSLQNIDTPFLQFHAEGNSTIQLDNLATLRGTNNEVRATGTGSIVDLSRLCHRDGTELIEETGGDILHQSVLESLYFGRSLFGVRSVHSDGSCNAPESCPASYLFSLMPNTSCFQERKIHYQNRVFPEVDGLALSESFGVVGFQINRNQTDGQVTGSQLIAIDPKDGQYQARGNFLPNREIRGAAFLSDFLIVIDVIQNELLVLNSWDATILIPPVQITDGILPLLLTEETDIAISEEDVPVLVVGNKIYGIDFASGITVELFTDNAPLEGLPTPHFSGLAFTPGSTGALFALHSFGTDRTLQYTPGFTREAPLNILPNRSIFDGALGDLASISSPNRDAPGPVTIAGNGNTDGTSVNLDWTTYVEAVNGNDIDHYTVYQSQTSFSNIHDAEAVGETSGNQFTVTGLSQNETYYFAVVAFDTAGNFNLTVTSIPVQVSDTLAPPDVATFSVTSLKESLTLSWTLRTEPGDLKSFRLYQDNTLLLDNIPALAKNYTVNGLAPGTRYSYRLTTVDSLGNESRGESVTGWTWLPKLTSVTVKPEHSSALVSWDPLDASAVRYYHIFVQDEPFINVSNLTPTQVVSSTATQFLIPNLTNGRTYYIAVAALNESNAIDPNISSIPVIPRRDFSGPDITQITYSGQPISLDNPISLVGEFLAQVSDLSAVASVEFALGDGSIFTIIGIDSEGPDYSTPWNPQDLPTGDYTLRVRATDTFRNATEEFYPIRTQLGPPPPPTLLSPVGAVRTAKTEIDVAGRAQRGTTLFVSLNGEEVIKDLSLDSRGEFLLSLPLAVGENIIALSSEWHGFRSPWTPPLIITLDRQAPTAPTAIVAKPNSQGEIEISWTASTTEAGEEVRYNVYRATQSVHSPTTETLLNPEPLSELSYVDLPEEDGDYFYRVEAVSASGAKSPLSPETNITSDRTPPKLVSLQVRSSGSGATLDSLLTTGPVAVLAVFDEPILGTPFLSLTPAGGYPISISLSAQNATTYEGNFLIDEFTPSGTAYFVYSGIDEAGNRGTEIVSGRSVEIDTTGPAVTQLITVPAGPIKNTPGTDVRVYFELSEAPKVGTIPSLTYRLSGAGRAPTSISSLTPANAERTLWNGEFRLPNDAGSTDSETLAFSFEAIDDLNNKSTKIHTNRTVQVYRDSLPPLMVPTRLAAKPLPGGAVELSWSAVPEAKGYELLRAGPGSGALPRFEVVSTDISAATFQDTPPSDGSYLYQVKSIRIENGERALSAASPEAEVLSDRIPPSAPTNLTLKMQGGGVLAKWEYVPDALLDLTPPTYRLYRSSNRPALDVDINTAFLLKDNIPFEEAFDGMPSTSQHAYVVVAVDEAGNVSSPSNTMYIPFSLAPIAQFEATVTEGEVPLLQWTHESHTVQNYKLSTVIDDNPMEIYGGEATEYRDQGHSFGARMYQIVGVDHRGVNSHPRDLLLPDLRFERVNESPLERGVFNTLSYLVQNESEIAVPNLSLTIEIGGDLFTSETFSLEAGENFVVEVHVPGKTTYPTEGSFNALLEYEHLPGSIARFKQTSNYHTIQGALRFNIETAEMVRGTKGQARLVVENTSKVQTELILSSNYGALPSSSLRFKTVDRDGNTASVTPFYQTFGEGLVLLPNGESVARIEPGKTFHSEWLAVDLPSSLSNDSELLLEIDALYSNRGSPNEISLGGTTVRQRIDLSDIPYFGEVVGVDPDSSLGDEIIRVFGRALSTDGLQPLSFTKLDLVFRVNGFEIVEEVITDQTGYFVYYLDTEKFQVGSYQVLAVYPGSLERPEQETFSINGLTFKDTQYDIRLPINYEGKIDVQFTSLFSSPLKNFRFEIHEADQTGREIPAGLFVNSDTFSSVPSGEELSLPIRFGGGKEAPRTGVIRLRALSDTTGERVLGYIDFLYQFSSARPSLYFEPTTLLTGISRDDTISEKVIIGNQGLAPVGGGTLTLLHLEDETPAPTWIYLTNTERLAGLGIGETTSVDLIIQPDAQIPTGYHEFLLRAVTDEGHVTDLPVVVAVTEKGIGNLRVHVSDIYTATLDENGELIQGLSGARLKLVNEDIRSIEFTVTTDELGEALFSDIPAGAYILRASAPNHNDKVARVRVRPGVTLSEDIFLLNGLVTVEWSVVEIPLQDRYEILLEATYETNVPAPVLVFDPLVTTIPALRKGETIFGELRLTNFGLIRADNVTSSLPASDEFYKYEFLATFPDSLEARESFILPYRITALQDTDPALVPDASGGAGGCYQKSICVSANAICPSGDEVNVGACSGFQEFFPGPSSCVPKYLGGGASGFGYSHAPAKVPHSGGKFFFDIPCAPGFGCSAASAPPDS